MILVTSTWLVYALHVKLHHFAVIVFTVRV